MNSATEFDVGPLGWVKSEIDLALARAEEALQRYTASTVNGAVGDLTQIKFCRTHLHQVQGALTIVGLDGVTQFTDALESFLVAIEQQTRPANPENIALVSRSLAAIHHYLDELIVSQLNQPLRLFPLYQEVQVAQGQERASATDLFFPDLNVRPPRRASAMPTMDPAKFLRLLRQERARFQHGLLAWLRAPQERAGVSEMLHAVQRIEAAQDVAATRAFWWIATGFLSALAEGALPAETDAKQLCARIDLQIRRVLEGSEKVTERLMRDALYFVASADSSNSAVQTIKNAYQLQTTIPLAESIARIGAPNPQEVPRRRLREVIVAAGDAWNKFCAGTAQALPVFKEQALALSALVEQLGHTDYRRLAQAIVAATNWLNEEAARYSEALAMEVATALLLAQNAQENFQRLGNDFAHQVDVMVARIHGCIAGNPPQPGSEVPMLDEMSRQAQEKLLIGQVAKEIQSNLAQIEQVLDDFFRDAESRADLLTLETPLRQIVGALTIMRHDGAVAVLQQCTADIKRFAAPEYLPQAIDFERVANELSTIGFFIDALPHGGVDYERFVRAMQVVPEAVDEARQETVEQAVEQQKREAHTLLEAFKETPGDSELRAELKQNLTALQQDAELVADKALGHQTKAMLSVLATGDTGDTSNVYTPQIDAVLATLKPQSTEAPPPSAATIQLAQAGDEAIDAELLAIFIEEAYEVLGTIAKNLQLLRDQPYNVEVLTTLRRSFHTLKGSGRMVGLKSLGEVAWAIEQVLNVWLRRELGVGAPLFDLLGQAHEMISVWVKYLELHVGAVPDTQQLLALAELLKGSGDELSGEAAVATAEPVSNDTSLPTPAKAVAPALGPDLHLPPPVVFTPDSALPVMLDVAPSQTLTASLELTSAANEATESTADVFHFSLEGADLAQIESALLDEFDEAGVAAPDDESPMAVDSLPFNAPFVARDSRQPTLHEIFLKEAYEHLTTLQRGFLALEADLNVPTPHEMHIAAHTLAGIAGALEFAPVNRLALAFEHALLRRDQSSFTGSLEAFVIIRQTIAELDLMLSVVAEAHDLVPSPRLIDALDSLYQAPFAESFVSAVDAETNDVNDASLLAEPLPMPFLPTVPKIQDTHLQDELDEQLLPIFLEEALDLNQNISAQLRAWRAKPADHDPPRTLTRLLHTLKGSARMAGAMNLGAIAHAIETRIEAGERTASTDSARLELIDEIDNAYDIVIQIVNHLQNGESLERPENEAAAANTAPALSAENQDSPVDARQDLPEAEAEATVQRATLRVRADLIDRLVNESGELSIARARIEGEMRSLKDSLLDLTENVIRLRRQLRDIEIQAELQMQSRTAQAGEQHAGFDPLEFDRFTRFQELTRMMAESVNDVSTVQQNLFKNLDDANAAILAQARLNREVQQQLMAVRMLPFSSVADRLYRIVRQTAKELGKRANLEIRGGQIELDRSVLDKISAPLEHMLRNAVAHGLEDRDTRVAQGKADIGEIALTLTQEGNEIILNFSDDGAGLDFERIRERGLATGLLAVDEAMDTEADAARLSELIFTPGFSTASELSQISGRGIGMDVVKTEITALGGHIDVASTPGQGTSFRLYIPLTLAVTQALLVRAGGRLYAIPSVMIEQVRDVKEAALTEIRESGAAEWMDKRYPFHFLPQLLGETQAVPEIRRQYWILLLRSGNQRIALQVDELKGNQEIVVKNIGPQLARVAGIDGATVLGNGQVALILNPVVLANTRRPTITYAAPIPAVQASAVSSDSVSVLPTVMVVDDSLTVRKVTGRLLAREGYEVITAKDGVDALEQLLDVLPDVMLVDIEMPRMDGFDLTRNVRADARLKGIPIIMITSRTANKHRNYALEIGVNQYLGKPYQEEELLEIIADYVRKRREGQR
jgi:chemosensory pili system protein ChpA (sensor histidine kinase/response regulator)